MFVSVHLNSSLSCRSPSGESIPLRCKNPSTLSNSWGSCHGYWLKEGRYGIQKLDISSDTQLSHKVTTSKVSCKATNTAKNKVKFSRGELTESQLEKWEEASGFLEGLGFNAEEADRILGKAFGWVYSPFWSELAVQTVPELEMVSSKVNFVKEIGFTDVELTSVLKKFPELLGCRETLMKHNIGILDKDWGIAGKTLKNLVFRNPHVLGYTVDCKGDCMAQCTRCWVRF